ncbi:MAG: FliM/FliN family flagellar motor switch protein [Candidatus Margulisiibacteriota bacterium]
MTERSTTKPEIASQKKVVKLPPAIGDWTTYRAPKILVKKVKTGLYGFDRLSKEELKHLLRIHYRFTLDLLERCKIDLGLGIEFLACQVEQTTYINFLRGLNVPVAQGKIAVGNVHENILWAWQADLAHSLINYALGSHNLEIIQRGLTDVEKELFAATLADFLPSFNAAYEQVLEAPAFTYVSSPDFSLDPAVSTTATYVVFVAEVAINDGPAGKMIIGYPGAAIKTLLKAYTAKYRQKQVDFSRLPLSILNTIMIGAKAVLGQTALSSSEIDQLEVGDVVALDTPINSSIFVRIGNKLKLPSQPGQTAKKKALRIAGLTEEQVATTPPLAESTTPAQPGPITAPPPPPEEKPLAAETGESELNEAEYKPENITQDDAGLLDDEEFTEDIFAEDEETEMKEA